MRDAFIFGKLENHLSELLQLVERCPENKRKVIPEGFNNSLHWQIGHVLTVTEFHVFGLSEQTQVLPANYQTFFANGTKPADWQEEPPAWDLLIVQLKEQHNRIRESLKDKLEVSVKENFLKAETIGELIVSTVLHIVNHVGINSTMLKVLK